MEGPTDPGDDGSELLFATGLHPLPPTGLGKHEPRATPSPNGALQIHITEQFNTL